MGKIGKKWSAGVQKYGESLKKRLEPVHQKAVTETRNTPAVSQEDADKRVAEAGAQARAAADPLIARAEGISREQFGLGEADLARRAAERSGIFQQQQQALQTRQGVTQREMQEQMQRRLGAQGLRGTGTAERLSQVAERRFGQGSAQQAASLRLGQSQQEFAERGKERQSIMQIGQFREQSILSANELATRLEASGMSNEQSRIFASNQQKSQQDFQEHVVMPMQNEQFKQKLQVSMDQFDQNMKQRIREFDLDEEISRFNMKLALDEANKGNMFDALGNMGTNFWDNTFGRASGGGTPNVGRSPAIPFKRSFSPGTGANNPGGPGGQRYQDYWGTRPDRWGNQGGIS